MKKLFLLLVMLFLILSMITCTFVAANAEETDDAYTMNQSETQIYEIYDIQQDAPVIAQTGDVQLNVPKIEIVTENGNGLSMKKGDDYLKAVATFTDPDGTVTSSDIQIKVRGNSTALVSKKAYNIKFQKKQNLYGMGSGKKWALLANAFDPTLLRNTIALDLAQYMGLEFTSNSIMTELWLDGSLRGCYQLTEPVQEGKDRVNIDVESNEGKKDFLVEYEKTRYEEGETYIKINDLRFTVKEPEDPDENQTAYISETMTGIYDTIKAGNEEEIENIIDINSFVKYYILNEYLKTCDFDFSSTYFYFKNGKLYAGPPWDYDLSLGNENKDYASNHANANNPENLFVNTKLFYKYLCRYSWFNEKTRIEFANTHKYLQSIYEENGEIDTLCSNYELLFSRNFKEAGWKVSSYLINVMMRPLPTYEENLDFLKDWCRTRHDWLYDYFDIGSISYLNGDMDENDMIDIADVTTGQRLLAKISEDPDNQIKLRGDLNGDGFAIDDCTNIQFVLARIENLYGVGDEKYSLDLKKHKSDENQPQ